MVSQNKLQQIYKQSQQMRYAYLTTANNVVVLCEEIQRLRKFILATAQGMPAREDVESKLEKDELAGLVVALQAHLSKEVGNWS